MTALLEHGPALRLPPNIGEKTGSFLRSLSCEDPGDLHAALLAIGQTGGETFSNGSLYAGASCLAENLMWLDFATYLPDDLLIKVDRASMEASLEVRMPYLDTRVVNAAMGLPFAEKISGRTGKIILKKILAQYLPTDLIGKRKRGFELPLDSWLRGPLREWAGDTLHSHKGYDDEAECKRRLALYNDHI
jgi:asparagine synthase (glutamine-hydrolysing)